jgi:hypothetical protein
MSKHQYVNHMPHINMMELPFLPPFRGEAGRFTEDKLTETILFDILNSWKKEMDKFSFDPFLKTVIELIEFCERMEASDETGCSKDMGNFHEVSKKKSKSDKNNSNGSSNSKNW